MFHLGCVNFKCQLDNQVEMFVVLLDTARRHLGWKHKFGIVTIKAFKARKCSERECKEKRWESTESQSIVKFRFWGIRERTSKGDQAKEALYTLESHNTHSQKTKEIQVFFLSSFLYVSPCWIILNVQIHSHTNTKLFFSSFKGIEWERAALSKGPLL